MSNVINKKDLAEKLAEEFGCSKKDATAYVQFVFDTVADTLKDNGTVDVLDLVNSQLVKEQLVLVSIQLLRKKLKLLQANL